MEKIKASLVMGGEDGQLFEILLHSELIKRIEAIEEKLEGVSSILDQINGEVV